ncbi:hypothetical protein DFH94DRAFT_31845 [Russula ochroleuca]|uniref:Uncharacterized protein n=1 Tax=Russula ochroleuca TaxID=152965 RepID=A0A9P5T7I9_9AGAM|nr:hypothetical protein DFH94DRAFT_31845 [Russula ochroleuca]
MSTRRVMCSPCCPKSTTVSPERRVLTVHFKMHLGFCFVRSMGMGALPPLPVASSLQRIFANNEYATSQMFSVQKRSCSNPIIVRFHARFGYLTMTGLRFATISAVLVWGSQEPEIASESPIVKHYFTQPEPNTPTPMDLFTLHLSVASNIPDSEPTSSPPIDADGNGSGSGCIIA